MANYCVHCEEDVEVKNEENFCGQCDEYYCDKHSAEDFDDGVCYWCEEKILEENA